MCQIIAHAMKNPYLFFFRFSTFVGTFELRLICTMTSTGAFDWHFFESFPSEKYCIR